MTPTAETLSTLPLAALAELAQRVREVIARAIQADEDRAIQALHDPPPLRSAIDLDPIVCKILGRASGCPMCHLARVESTLTLFVAAPLPRADGAMEEHHTRGCSEGHLF